MQLGLMKEFITFIKLSYSRKRNYIHIIKVQEISIINTFYTLIIKDFCAQNGCTQNGFTRTFLNAKLRVHKKVTVRANLRCLICNVLIDIVFPICFGIN